MSKLDNLVQDFLSQKKIAIVGVSDKRETGCNAAYKNFKDSGYEVFAVNPRIASFQGDICYPDLTSLPSKPDAVFILANPKVTDQIVSQCVDLGHQTHVDALYDGHQAWSRSGHHQCIPLQSMSAMPTAFPSFPAPALTNSSPLMVVTNSCAACGNCSVS